MTHLENAKHTESDTSSDVTTEPESRLNPGCSETDALLGAHWLDLFPTETPNILERSELGKDEVEFCSTLTKEQTIEREKRIKLQRAISRLNATRDTAQASNDEEMIIAIPRYLFEYGSSTTTHRQGKRGLSFKKSFTISLAICSVLAMAIIIYAILFNLKIEQIQNRNDTNHP